MINFDDRLIEIFATKAKDNYVDTINIGLGYTAVVLKNGACGVSCTLLDTKKSCTVYNVREDFENKSCYDLLCSLEKYKDPVSRTVVIAMINALTQSDVLENDPGSLFEDLQLKKGDSLAMIGYFKPIVEQFKMKEVSIKAYDIGKEIGDEDSFYEFVNTESSALIITATSFINNTFAQIIQKIETYRKPVAVLGPSTIMNKSLYKGTPVKILGGTSVSNVNGVLKAIRTGKGTPMIHKFSSKVYKTI